jgi:hypothetical protein
VVGVEILSFGVTRSSDVCDAALQLADRESVGFDIGAITGSEASTTRAVNTNRL